MCTKQSILLADLQLHAPVLFNSNNYFKKLWFQKEGTDVQWMLGCDKISYPLFLFWHPIIKSRPLNGLFPSSLFHTLTQVASPFFST